MTPLQELQQQWNELRPKILNRWPQLTKDEVNRCPGSLDELVGIIQRRTGDSREAITGYLVGIAAATEHEQARHSSTAEKASEAIRQYAATAAQAVESTARPWIQRLPEEIGSESSWPVIRQKLHERWSNVSEDELQKSRGSVDQLIGTIQRRTGEARRDIADYLDSLTHGYQSPFDAITPETISEYASLVTRFLREVKQAARSISEESKTSDLMSRRYTFASDSPRSESGAAIGRGSTKWQLVIVGTLLLSLWCWVPLIWLQGSSVQVFLLFMLFPLLGIPLVLAYLGCSAGARCCREFTRLQSQVLDLKRLEEGIRTRHESSLAQFSEGPLYEIYERFLQNERASETDSYTASVPDLQQEQLNERTEEPLEKPVAPDPALGAEKHSDVESGRKSGKRWGQSWN